MTRSYAHGAHAGNGKVRTGLLPNMSGGRFGSRYSRLIWGCRLTGELRSILPLRDLWKWPTKRSELIPASHFRLTSPDSLCLPRRCESVAAFPQESNLRQASGLRLSPRSPLPHAKHRFLWQRTPDLPGEHADLAPMMRVVRDQIAQESNNIRTEALHPAIHFEGCFEY